MGMGGKIRNAGKGVLSSAATMKTEIGAKRIG